VETEVPNIRTVKVRIRNAIKWVAGIAVVYLVVFLMDGWDVYFS